MKKLVSLFTLLLAVTFTFAQVQPAGNNATETAPANGPEMTLDSETVDFGSIEQDSDPYRSVSFTNTGTEPLIIKNAKGSCGCTVPTYPKEPILPGESKEIKIRYATNRLGKINKTVTLFTNEGTDVKRMLKVVGNVTKKPEQPAGVPTVAPSILSGSDKKSN